MVVKPLYEQEQPLHKMTGIVTCKTGSAICIQRANYNNWKANNIWKVCFICENIRKFDMLLYFDQETKIEIYTTLLHQSQERLLSWLQVLLGILSIHRFYH